MRFMPAVLAAVVLSACHTAPLEPRTKPPDGGLAAGTFHCRVAGGPPKYPLCNDIPIIVLQDEMQVCSVLVPYQTLHVHGRGGPSAFVSWTLHAPGPYKFIANSVKITAPKEMRPAPSDVYVEEKILAGGRTLRFRLTEQPAPTTFNHVVVVVDSLDGNKPCRYVDPIIHNDAS